LHQAKLWATQVFELAKIKGKFTAGAFVQHHRAVQPLTVIVRLAKPSFRHQTARTDCHCASEKQPAKVDHSSVACFEYEINLFMYHSAHDEKLNLLI